MSQILQSKLETVRRKQVVVALATGVFAHAESLAGPMDFGRVIKTEKLTRIAVLALLALVIVGGTFAWAGESAQTLLKRALFLSDIAVPRKTVATSLSGSPLVAKGDA